MCACLHACKVINYKRSVPFGQTWEQEFAWTEADKPIKLAAKALTVPHNSKLSQAPIFCFETMMHMLYWTCLAYDYKRVRFSAAPPLLPSSVPIAMPCNMFIITYATQPQETTVAVGSC